MTTAPARFAELHKRECRMFLHVLPSPTERADLALAASLQQVLEQATAETAAGQHHDLGDLRQWADDLIALNRRGRDVQAMTEQEAKLEFDRLVTAMSRNERRRLRRELRKRGIVAA